MQVFISVPYHLQFVPAGLGGNWVAMCGISVASSHALWFHIFSSFFKQRAQFMYTALSCSNQAGPLFIDDCWSSGLGGMGLTHGWRAAGWAAPRLPRAGTLATFMRHESTCHSEQSRP